MRSRQNGHQFADDIFKCIFPKENVEFPIEIPLKFVPAFGSRTVLMENTYLETRVKYVETLQLLKSYAKTGMISMPFVLVKIILNWNCNWYEDVSDKFWK